MTAALRPNAQLLFPIIYRNDVRSKCEQFAMTDHELYLQDSIRAGLKGRCPRCGQGKLFKGFLQLERKCDACDLDYSFADPADGPAFMVLCVGCIPVIVFGLWLELTFNPAFWVHLVTTVPLILITCTLPLRPLKGWLVGLQYKNKAEEIRADQMHR